MNASARILPLAMALAVALSVPACDTEGEPAREPGFADVFAVADTIELEQPPGDSIAQVGATDVGTDGRLLIADRYLRRVRLYDSDGRFIAGQGRFGQGPFEYQSVSSVALARSGQVFVNDVRSARYTILSGALEPDTVLRMEIGEALPGSVDAFSEGVVQVLQEPGPSAGRTGGWSLYYRDSDGERPWRVNAAPARLFDTPYWGSFARLLIAVSGDTLLVGNSLLYPIEMFDAEGRSLGTIGNPPPSYREPPEFERGEFAFQDPGQAVAVASRFRQYASAFRPLAGIYVVADRWLVVPHGTFPEEGFPYVSQYDVKTYAVDVYDVQSREKVAEDLPWPETWRIIGGGPHLHVLVGEPPDPWRVARLEVTID